MDAFIEKLKGDADGHGGRRETGTTPIKQVARNLTAEIESSLVKGSDNMSIMSGPKAGKEDFCKKGQAANAPFVEKETLIGEIIQVEHVEKNPRGGKGEYSEDIVQGSKNKEGPKQCGTHNAASISVDCYHSVDHQQAGIPISH